MAHIPDKGQVMPALATVAWPALVVHAGHRSAEVRFDNYRQYDVAP